VTKNTFAHSSVSQEDIFDIAYLDSCLQIFRLSPLLSGDRKRKSKGKEKKVPFLKKMKLSVETQSFEPKVIFQEVTLALSCQGQDILLAFSRRLFPFSFFFFFFF